MMFGKASMIALAAALTLSGGSAVMAASATTTGTGTSGTGPTATSGATATGTNGTGTEISTTTPSNAAPGTAAGPNEIAAGATSAPTGAAPTSGNNGGNDNPIANAASPASPEQNQAIEQELADAGYAEAQGFTHEGQDWVGTAYKDGQLVKVRINYNGGVSND